jgi:hypothetical protein
MKYVVLLLLSLCSTRGGYAQPTRALLDAAYREKSTPKLAQFLQDYQQTLRPISATDLAQLTPAQQQAYAVFAAFYEWHYKLPPPARAGGSEADSCRTQQTGFLVVQPALLVKHTHQLYYSDTALDSILSYSATSRAEPDSSRQARVRSLRKNGKLTALVRRNYGLLGDSFFKEEERQEALRVDSLPDFRPLLQVPGKQIIYLTPALQATLTTFLGNQHTPFGQGRLMQPARATHQSLKRQAFLERQVPVRYGHWGGYWQLASDPVVYGITFDQELTYARVSFRLGYRGGQAMFKRTGKQWQLVVEQPTWIE